MLEVEAKYDEVCSVCSVRIPEDTEAWLDPVGGHFYCLECYDDTDKMVTA